MGYIQPADFAAELNSGANHAWIAGFGQNTQAALSAGYGLAAFLPGFTDSSTNYVDFQQPVPYTAGGVAPSAGKIQRSTTQVISGASSLEFTTTESANTLQTRGPIQRCQGGRGYTLSMTSYREVAVVLGEIDGVFTWYDLNQAFISSSLVATFVAGITNDWRTTVGTVTAPANARYMAIGIACDFGTVGGARGSIYFDEMLMDSVEGGVPVGTVAAWDEWLDGVVIPPLPAGWARCDGSLVTDKLSIYYNTNLPNLNGPAAGAGNQGGQFLRGWNRNAGVSTAQAGATSASGLSAALPTHVHTMVGASAVYAHHHPISTSGVAKTTPAFSAVAANLRTDVSDEQGTTSGQTATTWSGNTGNNTTAPAVTITGATETRPANYPVTYIKRIR